MNSLLQRWLLPVLYLTDNWISRTGLFLVTTSTVLWIFLTGASEASGYLGILQFVALPAAFFAGLALIPVGISLERRRTAPDHQLHIPDHIDLQNTKVRRFLLFIGITTVANLVIGGSLTYQTVHYVESNNFCGTACHSVMGPEHLAFQSGAHSQVKCVQCHVGEGAGNAIRAKINGTRQLFLLMTGGYNRPIPVPPHQLKPAAETCENCHSANHEFGNRLWRRSKFDDDGERLDTALLLKLGGTEGRGIHGAHMGPHTAIEYEATDPKRSGMLSVRITRNGKTEEFATDDFRAGKAKSGFSRRMDCLDCHNRPAHEFQNPEHAVDEAMTDGRIPSAVPLLRKAALEVLASPYASREAATAAIPSKLTDFYRKNRPEAITAHRAELDRTAAFLQDLYLRNVYPEMKITWGTYPQNIGHTDSPGCFRCHGDELKSKAGKTITQDCEACHKVLGVEEKNMKALQELGEGS